MFCGHARGGNLSSFSRGQLGNNERFNLAAPQAAASSRISIT